MQIIKIKFALLVDLGIIVVPENYIHGKCLEMFFKNNHKKLYDYNKEITDANFSHPSRILKPGDKLRVRAFRQIVSGSTTSQERMAFLSKQLGNIYVGAQGAALVFEQKRDQLSKGEWYSSFDEAKNLWEDSDGYHRLVNLNAYFDGLFEFSIGYLEGSWIDNFAFLGFSLFLNDTLNLGT